MKLSSTNKYYNQFAEDYYETTKNIDLKKVYNIVTKYFDKTKLLLDLGCGPGRDSLYFKNLGYKTVSFDLSFNLLKICLNNSCNDIVNGNMLQLPFKKSVFGFIFANASLLHIPKKRIGKVIKELHRVLDKKSFMFATFKTGIGESFDDRNRFFSYYTNSEIIEKFTQNNFEIVSIENAESSDNRKILWISLVVKPL